MNITNQELQRFYKGALGHIVYDLVTKQISSLWPDVRGLRILGTGYAFSYLEALEKESERSIHISSLPGAVHKWPKLQDKESRLCSAHALYLPLENNVVDRALMIHHLEFVEDVHAGLLEIWRVLKAEGRAIIVFPNRSGLWARTESSPFGYGRPFTCGQAIGALENAGFRCISRRDVLFLPPFDQRHLLQASGALEKVGRYIPFAKPGLHILEVRKEMFAGIRPSSFVERCFRIPKLGAKPVGAMNVKP